MRRVAVGISIVTLAIVMTSGSTQAARSAAPAQVERVRYEADGATARVVILLSRSVPHEVMVLDGDAVRGSQRRVVIDFSNARLGPAAREPIGIKDGILQGIRTGQFTARTARIVLDLANLQTHSVKAFRNPPRLVVDVAGRAPAPPPVAAPRPTRAPPEFAAPAAPTPSVTSAPPRAARLEPPSATFTAAPARPPGPIASRPPRRRRVPRRASSEAGPVRIILDPGHGGNDPGAQGVGGVREKDVVLAIAKALKERLEAGTQATVLLTRDHDVTMSLADRTAFANAREGDLFISIHANADETGKVHGIETYTLNNSNDRATVRLASMENGPGVRFGGEDLSFILSDLVQSGKEEESNTLAERVQAHLLMQLRSRHPDVRNLGVKKGPFFVLVGAYMPCVLVETSFLTHPVEGRRLATSAYQADIAQGLYRGIKAFLADARMADTL